MNHEEWLERAEIYAAGALDGAELAEFEAHLAAGCAAMRSELDAHAKNGCPAPDLAAEMTRHAAAMKAQTSREMDRMGEMEGMERSMGSSMMSGLQGCH